MVRRATSSAPTYLSRCGWQHPLPATACRFSLTPPLATVCLADARSVRPPKEPPQQTVAVIFQLGADVTHLPSANNFASAASIFTVRDTTGPEYSADDPEGERP
jgi:hypothetical protein